MRVVVVVVARVVVGRVISLENHVTFVFFHGWRQLDEKTDR